ncbi:MAG: hypothetical protein C0518_03990 [Opitutus sp.]|nr:hypothetical protein [Opitutus sp.]
MKAAPLRRVVRAAAIALLGLAVTAPLRATTVVPPVFDQLVNESDYVVRAVVESVRAEYRDGPQGRLILTKVRLRIRETAAGQPPAIVELEMLGGRIGDDRLIVNGAPVFRVGDEDFLFVRDNGRTITPLVAMMHGRYPVHRDPVTGREFVARSNDVPLQDVAEVALPMTSGDVAERQRRVVSTADALTPAEFVTQIRSTRRADYVRQKLH